MISFVVAYALLLHVFLWGAGLGALAMPDRWRRFWPVLVLPAGFALQSLAVWAGAHVGRTGSNGYAWYAEALPVGLLAVALWRCGIRAAWRDLGRFGLVWIAVAAVLLFLTLPLAIADRGLTSVSLGSCDAADYAAGARVFMEFGPEDRGGFMGLTEVVRVMSADNFQDFWLRLNHFTPSALMALNGSVLHCGPHQLASLITSVVLAALVPVVFWVARALFGYSGAASLTIAAVFGISPVPWYSLAHVSPAPLLAATAIALLAWAGVALWHGRFTAGHAASFGGVLAIAWVLILGSYNFILLVCLVPAAAYTGIGAMRAGAWRRWACWWAAMLAPLAVVGLAMAGRVTGLIERFRLFQTYDFGWRIPVLMPDGWLGMVAGGSLQPWGWGVRWVLALMVIAALAWSIERSMRARWRRLWLVAAVTVPVLLGYGFLEIRGVMLGTNASYDAFKLFSVFYPLLLPAFCWWITLRWTAQLSGWVAVAGVAVVVIAFNLLACGMYVWQVGHAPLRVDGELRQVRRVEAMTDVASVNVLLPDMWSRLWANAFLLRKPQYFATHTYEGRLNTPLRGEWDLVGDVVRAEPRGGFRAVTAHYSLADVRSEAHLRVEVGAGWYAEERLSDGERWRWTGGDALIELTNPHSYPIVVSPRLDGHGLGARDVALVPPGGVTPEYVAVGPKRSTVHLPDIVVPPGPSQWVLRSRQPAASAGTDGRPLAVCVYRLALESSRAR